MEETEEKLSVREQYRLANERDKRWLSSLNLKRLDNILWPLFVAFVCLNFLDIYTTSIALGTSTLFREENVLAAKLFSMKFQGFMLALIIKFAPALPLSYAVFMGETKSGHSYQVRLIKVGALAALVAGDLFYVLVVLFNNIPVLVTGTMGNPQA
jgi:hypothetical protein